MATGTLSIVANIGGVSIQKTITETGDHSNVYGDGGTMIALAAGKAAANWVATNTVVANFTLVGGHGYTTGKMDIYWNAGVRYDVDAVVSSNAVSLTNGTGNTYPANASTDVIACAPQAINTAIDGDNVQLLCINATQKGSVLFKDASGDNIAQVDLVADQPFLWNVSSGQANPLTGDPITVCYASNGTVTAGVLTIMSLEDSTP